MPRSPSIGEVGELPPDRVAQYQAVLPLCFAKYSPRDGCLIELQLGEDVFYMQLSTGSTRNLALYHKDM